MEVCTEILQHTNDDINFLSIRDCFLLSKYIVIPLDPDHIQYLLNWHGLSMLTVLYNRSKAPNRIMIKLDMNPEERKTETEAALLSERWKLISLGVDRRDIKIKGSKLLVKGKKYEEVVNLKFVSTTPMDTNVLPANNDTPADVQFTTKYCIIQMPISKSVLRIDSYNSFPLHC